MSKKINVNPAHYKTGGRERQGDDVVQEIHKKEFAEAKVRDEKGQHETQSEIPFANQEPSERSKNDSV